MIITIDGYAGSGKSRAAAELAHVLGFQLLNTGAMYRAAGIALAELQIDIYASPAPFAAMEPIVAGFHFDMPEGQVWLNGLNYTDQIGSETAGKAASKIGTFLKVRERLIAEQRRIAQGQNIICEGRDQGTDVFPDAEVKFFFTASLAIRTQRRVQQLANIDPNVEFSAIQQDIQRRDQQDETRKYGALRPAKDAITVDTTSQTPEEVLAFLVKVVQDHGSIVARSSDL